MSEHISNAESIIAAAKTLYNKNYLAGADGNISMREDDTVIITPSGIAKSTLSKDDFARVTLEGEVISGKPSSELLMHLAVYQQRPSTRAVIHAHPPKAIAYTVANPQAERLPKGAISELILSVGDIPIAPYARPGTSEMAESIKPYLANHKALILQRHGALSLGETLAEALRGMERIEHTAEILVTATLLGGITELPESEIDYLKSIRAKLGDTTL